MTSTPEEDAVAAAETASPPAVPVYEKLKEFGCDSALASKIMADLGIVNLADLGILTETDLVNAGMKVVQARNLVNSIKPVVPVADAAAIGAASFDILPSVSDDSSWLEALKAGGVLKVNQSSVVAVVRAALANRVNLFDVPAKLATEMERYADTNDEQVSPEFYGLLRLLTRRNYADIFAAIDGLDGSFVTNARKKQLFDRIDTYLWPAIIGFYDQLKSWQEAWTQGAANPAMLMMAISAGTSGMALPPGMMQPPDTGVLRDRAESINDAINKVFAGLGVQIAAALAYDATQVRKSLEDPRLPAMIGAANREQMLKQLGVSVNSTYPRLENSLTRFVLSCMQVKDQPEGNVEISYFSSLYMLGSQIPWDQLVGRYAGGSVSGIAGRTQL
jgi:hypothetical protein